MNRTGSEISRHRTAIFRQRHSRPITHALVHGIIQPNSSVLDYGCGRGEDVRYLKTAGVEACGWDPYYQPQAMLRPADVVNLGYVLNVIEDPMERSQTLLKAFSLAQRALVVAVRVEHGLETGTEFSDGFLTSRGSFQKLFKQSEFNEYLRDVLGYRPHMVNLGIAYVFKDQKLESEYLASLSDRRLEASRASAIDQFSNDSVAQQYMRMVNVLGRFPLPTEYDAYVELANRFGSVQRIERLARQCLSPEMLREPRDRRRNDILTYIAMMRLQGVKPLPFRSLPKELRSDIRMLWPSYATALKEGEEVLFKIGDPILVRTACQSAPVGKKLAEALYVHRSAEEQLGALLRVVIFAARQVVGEIEHNLIKISTDGRSISLLQYNDFDQSAHPELRHSVRVYLPKATYTIRDYSNSLNPPILHRKDVLVDMLYSLHSAFADLTSKEEQLGLLSRPDIGTKNGWLALLSEMNLTIEGHEIFSEAPAEQH